MAKTIRDTDYLAVSARIRAMETRLLTVERMEQLLSARTEEEVTRVLQDCGYPALSAMAPDEMDAALAAVRRETLKDLSGGVPDVGYLDVFKLQYDYHNAKAILKAGAMGTDPASMLTELGRVPAEELRTQTAERIEELVLSTDVPESDAVFISCTNVEGFQICDGLERKLGKPVLTSNVACLWSMLRAIENDVVINDHGILLREHLHG